MLEQALRLIGIDLQAHIAELKARVEAYKEASVAELKAHVVALGVTAGMVAAGAVFAFMTLVVGLVALYFYLADHYGQFVALGGVAATTAFLAIVFFAVGLSRGKSETARQIEAIRAQEASRRDALVAQAAASAAATRIPGSSDTDTPSSSLSDAGAWAKPLFADHQFHKPLSTVFSTFFSAPLSRNATIDKVARQMTSKLADKSEETVAVAAHVMRTGPKSAFYSVLAASALVGFMLTRQGSDSGKNTK